MDEHSENFLSVVPEILVVKWVNHTSMCVCVLVSLNQRNPVGFTLALCEIKLFKLLSLFNSSLCGRVDEK